MKPIYALLVAVLVASVARADAVSDFVAQMPAKDVPAESDLAAKAIAGGAPAVKGLCAQLVPLGTQGKDDTKARYAVSALVRYVGQPNHESDRAALVQGLCESLSEAKDVEIRTFLVNRLQEVGHDDAVPTLAPLLADEDLARHAAAALERVGTPAATDALNKALPSSTGAARVAIIKSLGMLRSAASIDEIAKSLDSDDKNLKAASIWALANLGSDRVTDALNQYVKQGPAYERSKGISWMLLAARRQAEAGRNPQCVQTCKSVMALASSGAAPVSAACAALHVLAETQGEAALPDLLEAAGSDHPQVRNTALDAALLIPGEATTARFADRMKSLSPAAKVDVLSFLGRRKDAGARPAIQGATKDADPGVRVAAVAALVSLGREEAIPALIDRITSDQLEVARPAADMLARIPGDKPLTAAAEALGSAPAKSKVALLELLAARGARGQKDAVLKQTADTDASVRLAALRAMEKIATADDAPRLVELAVAAKDAGEVSAALRAATAAGAQIADAEHRADPFLAALANAKGDQRAAIERAMARVGGKRAFDTVLADAKSNDPATRDGAVRALAEWQDAAAIAPLLEVAKSDSADASLQVTAIRGVIQVAKAAEMSGADKAAAYQQAMDAAKRPEEKKMILGAVGNEKGQAFFDLAAGALDQPELQREAALAVIKTALPPGRGQAGLKGEKVTQALGRAIPHCPDPGLRGDAERYLKSLTRQERK
ncbi:MAG TPA: HEAT repeat domain-containing protein [Tepidisphaeraceae bacterium]|jgi:HEAT repeat protein